MIKQVTGLTNAAAALVVTPSDRTRLLIIQNNGAGNVRLSFDGGSANNQPYGNQPAGTDPTSTTGYKLATGQQLVINALAGGGGLHYAIYGRLESATTTTLDIITDDMKAV